MSNKILLTGAGFSKNFGAPLAAEMSDLLFNDFAIQNQSRIRTLLQEDFDYEAIYQKVMQTDSYTEEEKKALTVALNNAYRTVDEYIINYSDLSQTYNDLFKSFIFKFAKTYGGSGFIFTLNQDLVLERRFCHYPDANISSLELPAMASSVFQKKWDESLSDSDRKILPDINNFDISKNEYERNLQKGKIPLSYIKLHGSQEWYTDNNRSMMVIGYSKSTQIKSIPLLKWYLQLFEQQLKLDDIKLLIIGYGFNDPHINEAIANANSNLKIYIINPMARCEFVGQLKNKKYGEKINNAINSYYPRTLLELFPNNPIFNPHSQWKQIQSQFFNN